MAEGEGETGGQAPGAIAAIQSASGRTGVAAAWLVLILALSGPVLNAFQSAVVAPLGSSIAHRFGGGDHGAMIAQLALALPAAGVILGGPLTGWLIGRWGYRPVIVVNALLLALAGSAGAWLDDIIPFLIARLLVGLGAVGLYSALVALNGLLFSGVTLARMISYQSGLAAFLGMLLTLLSGAVASHFGWRTSFLIYLVVSLFSIVAMIAWLPSNAGRAQAGGDTRGWLRPMIPTLAMAISTFMVIYMVLIQGSLLMAANGIGDPSVQSVVIAASSLANATSATFCSWIETHLFRRWTFAAALALLGAGCVTMGAIPAFWGAVPGSLLIGAGSGLSVSYLIRIVVERAPPGARERAAGLIAPSFYIAQFANPLVMQSLREAIGIQRAFILVGVILFGGAAWAAASKARG